jgi:hypothetical protein
MSIEAMKAALEALESWKKTCLDCGRASEELGRATAALHLLRQAIAQAEQAHQRTSLTVDQIFEEWKTYPSLHLRDILDFARAIERAISIENGKDVLRAHLDGCEQKREKLAIEKLKADISTQWKLGSKGESGEWREPEWER